MQIKSFMKYHFSLQYLRFKRDCKSVGINPYLGIGVVVCSFIIFSEIIFKKISYSSLLYLLTALIIVSTFGEEIRNQFLKSIFPPIKFRKLRLLENLFAAAPFSIFLVLENHYLLAIITLALSGMLSLFNKMALKGIQIPSPFSKNPYEFTVGFRRNYVFILTIYSVAFLSVYYHNFILGLLSLLGMFLLCLTFYSVEDPIYYVWIHSQSSKVFLRNKIRIALRYSFSLGLVIVLPLVCFYYFRIGLILLTLTVGLLYVVLGILAVYVNFPSKRTVSQNIQFYFAICIPPFLLFVIPNMYYQSIRRLKEYLEC